MLIRLITPGDRDFSAAPVGGLHFNAVTGSDSKNDGSSANKAYRSADFLPSALTAGQKIYIPKGSRQILRRRTAQVQENSVAWTVNAAGAAGNNPKLMSWGQGPDPIISSDILSGPILVQQFGPVSNSHGNAFLAANGEQARFPAWCSAWHAHYVGADMLTPAFWCANSPGSNPAWDGTGSANPGALGDVSRWEFGPSFRGSEGIFFGTSAFTQAGVTGSSPWGPINYDAAKKVRYKVLDAAGAVAAIASGANAETVVQIQHPAIAARYGAAGPVGAWLRLLCNAQANRYLRIVDWDFATSTLTATTGVYSVPSGGPHHPQAANDSTAWAIIGHPLDLAQEGQFAQLPVAMTGATERAKYDSAEAAEKDVWTVIGSWMEGERSVANRPQVCKMTGARLDIEGIQFGRSSGTNTASTPLGVIDPGTMSDAVWTRLGLCQVLQKSEDSLVYGAGVMNNMTVNDIYARETPQCGFWRNNASNSIIDGMTSEELGRTGLLLRSDGGPARAIVRNAEVHNLSTVHGNVDSTYGESKRVTIENCWNTNSARGSTSQVEFPKVGDVEQVPVDFHPRDIVRRNSIYAAPRAIGITPGVGFTDLDNVSYDSAFGGCKHDRLFVVSAQNSGIRIGPSGSPPSPDNGAPRRNDDGLVLRCYTHGFSQGSGAAAVAGGANLEIRDSVITKGAAPSAPCTVTRTLTDPAELSLGGFSLEAWEYCSRTDPFNPGAPTYEAFTVGSERLNWSIPAFSAEDPAAVVGAPVPLMVSVDWYRFGHMAGKTVACLARMRPGSNSNTPDALGSFWIDPTYEDGASFILDTGYIVPVVRLTKQKYTVKFRERTIAGVTLDTVIEFHGRR